MRKALFGAVTFVVSFALLGAVAWATPTPEGIVSGGASDLKDSLFAVATAVMPFAAGVIAIGLGWRFARRALKL